MIKQLIFSFLFLSQISGSDIIRSSVVRSANGFIDYANRVIVCRGTADIEQKQSGDGTLDVVGTNLKLSKAEARARARENLVDLIKIVNFDGRAVSELMLDDRVIESRIESLISSAFQQGEIEYLESIKKKYNLN